MPLAIRTPTGSLTGKRSFRRDPVTRRTNRGFEAERDPTGAAVPENVAGLVNQIPAMVRSQHFSQWVEQIRELKRQGQPELALVLLLECVDATERDGQGPFPAPWYTWAAAVIFRQRRDYAAEVEILERWVNASSGDGDRSVWGASALRMFPRLERARDLAQEAARSIPRDPTPDISQGG